MQHNQQTSRHSFIKTVIGATFTSLVLASAVVLFINKPSHAAAACSPSTSNGTDTLTVTVPSTATYNAWVRMQSPDGTNNQVMMSIDGGTCNTMGATMAANTWTWVDTAAGSSSAVSVSLTAGTHTVVLTGNEAGVGVDTVLFTGDTSCTPTGTGTNCEPPLPVTVPYYLNAGGPAYTDTQGNKWAADQYYTMDNTFSDTSTGGTGQTAGDGSGTCNDAPGSNSDCTNHAITNTTNQEVFQSERWGDFHYDVPVNNGNYTVELLFAETNPNVPTRNFNVSVEGKQVLSSFSVDSDAGGLYAADTKAFPVTVANNDLNLTFTSGTVDNPMLKGIEILPASAPTVSISAPTSGATVSGSSVSLSAAASDSIGIKQVQFQVDGTNVGSADTSSPYTTTWDSTSASDGNHTITAIATNQSGVITTSSPITVAVANHVCSGTPTAPSNLNDSDSAPFPANKVDLTWGAGAAATNCTLAGYNIYRNGTKINSNPLNQVNYSDTTVASNTSYTYQITAVDTAGHESAKVPATPLSVKTGINCAQGSGTPTTPSGLSESANNYTSITLSWSGSTVNDGCTIAGYHVYRNGSTTPIATVTTTGYTDPSLTSGTSYSYSVAAYDTGGNTSSASTAVAMTTKTDNVAPTMPTGLSGTAPNAATVNLTWTGSNDLPNPGAVGVSGYQVYRDDSTTPTATVTSSSSGAISYTDSSAKPSTTYKYAVAAVDKNGNVSSETADISVTTPAAVVSCTGNPSTPTSLASTGKTITTISLSWTASTPASGCTIAGYQVFRNHQQIATATGTTYNDSNLSVGTSYVYTLVAVDGNGHQSAATADFTTSTSPDTTAPSNPANVTVTAPSPGQVTLSWTASTDNVAVAGYNVYRNGSTTPANTSLLTGTTYSDTNVTQNTTYTYTVQAVDTSGNVSAKVATNPTSITTPKAADTTAPSTPTGLKAGVVTANAASLSWTASTDNVAVAGYKVFRNGTLVSGSSLLSTTSYSDTSLSPSTAYSYTVQAVDTSGNVSSSSSALVITTLQNTSSVPGDVNSDSVVDIRDFNILLIHWGQSSATKATGDLNNDGQVNILDLNMFLIDWGNYNQTKGIA